ncbi:unnamed protein product [Merluccius merluccius]
MVSPGSWLLLGCLKSQLTSPPVLAHFDPASPTLVTCDASAMAIGAVMSQLQRGGGDCLCLTGSQPHGIEQYNFCLQFTPGWDNVVADLLSHAIPNPPPDLSLAPGQDQAEHNLDQLLYTPLQETM